MNPTYALHTGDAGRVLALMPARSVQACVTSPPYFRIRDYGVDGQLGREATPLEYVRRLVGILSELPRVMKPDGVLWLNLGDTYAGSRTGGRAVGRRGGLLGVPWRVALAMMDDGWLLRCPVIWHKPNGRPEPATNRPTLSHEDVFMLTRNEDYWYNGDAIRGEYAEATLKEMRREYSGRPKKDYAAAGVQEPGAVKARIIRSMRKKAAGHGKYTATINDHGHPDLGGPNARSVWTIPTQPTTIPHFALMPLAVAERCILASTRPAGRHCDCEETIKTPTGRGGGQDDSYLTTGGAGLRRPRQHDGTPRVITRRVQRHHAALLRRSPYMDHMAEDAGSAWEHYIRTDRSGARPIPPELLDRWIHAGWLPGHDEAPPCTCPLAPPDVVLDPFAGAGTTGVAALSAGRSFVGIELNPEYVDHARRRLGDVAPLIAQEEPTHADPRPQ
ncbi:MAG: site-specific DNA-methyltransferase [Acidobacteria bacterium]|nr:site-specific DNA-methyltransferase [Acidobacteriota bacterium]